jgi:hypothetical protein
MQLNGRRVPIGNAVDERTTHNMQRTTCNAQHATHNMQRTTGCVECTTRNMQRGSACRSAKPLTSFFIMSFVGVPVRTTAK